MGGLCEELEKFPPCPTELIPTSSKRDLLQDKAKPISDSDITSAIKDLRYFLGEMNLGYRICSQRKERVLTASLVSNIFDIWNEICMKSAIPQSL